MTDLRHLTESDRHALADGTLPPDRIADAAEHLASCESCAADVGRIAALMMRVRRAPARAESADVGELWPSVRARIEESKVVRLAAPTTKMSARGGRRRTALTVGLPAAIAIAAAVVFLVQSNRFREAPSEAMPPIASQDSTIWLVSAVDSAHAFEEEAQAMVARLELQRATMRPEAVRNFERDLRVVDDAIAELKDAIVRDPANRALRQLLASSYRQKIDLVKRADNAGE